MNNTDELNNLVTYNGDTVHDMYVDYDCQINIDEDIDTFVDNLNDWDWIIV